MTAPIDRRAIATAALAAAPSRRARNSIAGRRSFVVLGWLVAAYAAAAFSFAAIEGWMAHGPLALGVAAAVVAIVAVVSRVRFNGAIAVVLATSFSAQIVWAAAADTQPFGEHGVLWAAAGRFAESFDIAALGRSASPGAVGVWGAAMAIVGDDVAVLRIVAAMFWAVQTWFVWRIAHMIPEVRPLAIGAAALFGLAPAAIAFGGVISAEAVFGMFALAALYALLSHRRRGLRRSALIGGALAGCAYLVAPVGFAYFLGLLAVLVIGLFRARSRVPRRRLALALGGALAGFASVAGAFALLVSEREGLAAIVPVDSIGYQLLVGTNRRSVDGYSVSDLESAGFIGSEAEIGATDASDAAAARIAFDRVVADPLGFIGFATTEKLRRLWRSEREALSWSLESPGGARAAWLTDGGAERARLAADGALIALLAAAAVAAARLAMSGDDVSDPTRWVLIFAAVIALAAFHLVLDAQERRHMAFAPLLAVLAPFATARLQTRARLGRIGARASKAFGGSRRRRKGRAERSNPPDAGSAGPRDRDLNRRDRSGADARDTKTRTAPVRS